MVVSADYCDKIGSSGSGVTPLCGAVAARGWHCDGIYQRRVFVADHMGAAQFDAPGLAGSMAKVGDSLVWRPGARSGATIDGAALGLVGIDCVVAFIAHAQMNNIHD